MQKHRAKGAEAEGDRPLGALPKAAPVFLIVLYHEYLWIFLICSLYISYLYVLDISHILSFVCILIYSVNTLSVA